MPASAPADPAPTPDSSHAFGSDVAGGALAASAWLRRSSKRTTDKSDAIRWTERAFQPGLGLRLVSTGRRTRSPRRPARVSSGWKRATSPVPARHTWPNSADGIRRSNEQQLAAGPKHRASPTPTMEHATPSPAAAAAAAGVTATVDLSPAAADLGGVHLLPCGIRQNGAAPVSDYFKPRSTGVEVEGVRVEEAFFRGRKLQGATLALPDGYRGYVLEKKSADAEVSNFVSRAEFQNITYWNHDTTPSAEDPLPRCFHWLTVADAMHKPVTAEELANMSATQNQDN
ncbi:hypothetical protein ACP70R_028872 [Stipagrostis hirtigluma subsp. patula]